MHINLYIPWSYIIITLLSIVVVADLALAWRTWIGNRTHPNNIFFALAVLMAGLWVMGLIGYWTFNSSFLISLSLRLTYVFPVLIAFFFYLFSYYFPYKLPQIPNYIKIVVVVSCVMIIVSAIPDAFVKGQILPENRFQPENNDLGQGALLVYFLGVVGLSFSNLWRKFKLTDGIWRQRLRQVMTATGVAFIGGIVFALFLPVFLDFYLLDWVGPLFSLFMFAYIFWKTNRRQKESSYDPYPY